MKNKSYFTLLIKIAFIGLLLFPVSCSNKKDNTEINKEKPTTNTQSKEITEQKNKLSYQVTSSGETIKKNELVDFNWSENGKEVKLSDYKGSVIVLNFWATWCPPCRKELPSLSQIASELKNKKFKLIGVSVDEKRQTLDDFLKKNNLDYLILHEPSDLITKYMESTGSKENVIPQTFIINKDGKIVETIVGSRSKEQFLSLINKYL